MSNVALLSANATYISSWSWQEQAAEQPLSEQPLSEQPLLEQPLPEQPVWDALRSFHHNTNLQIIPATFPPDEPGKTPTSATTLSHWPLQ